MDLNELHVFATVASGEEFFAGGGTIVSDAAGDQHVHPEAGAVGGGAAICARFPRHSIDGRG